MVRKLSRRCFIKLAAWAGLSLAGCFAEPQDTNPDPAPPTFSPASATPAFTLRASSNAPQIPGTPVPTSSTVPTQSAMSSSTVIHIHAPSATRWPPTTVKYWNYVDQALVAAMVDRGIVELTGQSTVADAWRSLLPGYNPDRPGQVAIKINCNSIESIDDEDEDIESVAEPILGMIAGLVLAGVPEGDICIFDAVRGIPDRIVLPIQTRFPGVAFYDGYFRTRASFSSAGEVRFNPPGDIPTPTGIQVTDVLVNARYLINAPLLKKHSLPGISFGFKHHFGSINRPAQLHDYIGLSASFFREDYSVFVDIFKNPHIGPKTILTVADGLFGYTGAGGRAPSPWKTFDQQVPNSLFFSKDPVALDCILCDFLDAEINLPNRSDRYLVLAAEAGLGVYERANPWKGAYQLINYRKMMM